MLFRRKLRVVLHHFGVFLQGFFNPPYGKIILGAAVLLK
jgi:hypothetical protein